jgi:copper chaperone
MNTLTLKIEGMHCDGCAERIQTVIGKQQGVREAEVSYADGEARISYNPHVVTEQGLAGVIEGAGFSVVGG